LRPEGVDSFDDIFENLGGHRARVRKQVLVEQHAPLNHVARFECFGPIAALEGLNGGSQLTFGVGERLLLCLVNLGRVLLEHVGQRAWVFAAKLGISSRLLFRLTAHLLRRNSGTILSGSDGSVSSDCSFCGCPRIEIVDGAGSACLVIVGLVSAFRFIHAREVRVLGDRGWLLT